MADRRDGTAGVAARAFDARAWGLAGLIGLSTLLAAPMVRAEEPKIIVAHGISSRLHGKKVLVGSYHFLFEDERIPLTEEQRLTIRNHARGKSNIFLAIGRRAIGMIGVSDPPRPEAAETIARLGL